jgi:serine/threonine protein phosphatase PrpC
MILYYWDVNQPFLIKGDGIFDKLTNEEVAECVWDINDGLSNYHQIGGKAIESIIKNCFIKKSTDNLTVVFIGFQKM